MEGREIAARGGTPGTGESEASAAHSTSTSTTPATAGPRPLAPVIPIAAARRIGGRAWRKANGLETIADKVAEYVARRFTRPGALFPMPEDLTPGWREAAE